MRKQTFLNIAQVLDAFRIIPRILVTLYCVLLYNTTEWFTLLVDPTQTQAFFISILWGAGAAIFGLYVSSGNKTTFINNDNK